MNEKRRRVDLVKNENNNKPIEEKERPFTLKAKISTLNAISPIFFHLVRFMPLNDVLHLSSGSRILRALGKSTQSWIALLDQHYGKPYFFKEPHLQYQAFFYLEKAEEMYWYGRFPKFEKLRAHIEKHNKNNTVPTPWTFYFYAHIGQAYKYLLPRCAADYALDALRAGDLKAKTFLMNHFLNSWYAETFNAQHLETFLTFLQSEEDTDNHQTYCLMTCVLLTHSSYRGDRNKLKEDTFTAFFAHVNPDAASMTFINYFTNMLRALNLLSNEQMIFLRAHSNVKQSCHALEVIMNPLVYEYYVRDAMFSSQLERWVAQLAETRPDAAYYYAKTILSHTPKHLLTKAYLIKAIQGGEYRAVAELQELFINQPSAIKKEERDRYLKIAARKGSSAAINIFFKEKGWEINDELIWIFIHYVTTTNDQCGIKLDMENKTNKIEKTAVYVRCALTFIYGFEGNHDGARKQFLFAIASDPEIFKKFIQRGEELALCHENYKSLITEFQSEDNVSYYTSRLRSSH